MLKTNKKKAVAQAVSTAVALGCVIMQVQSAKAATLTGGNAGKLTINSDTPVIIETIHDRTNSGGINSPAGDITVVTSSIRLQPVTEPSAIATPGGNITINTGNLIIVPPEPVPEPNAIAGSILAGGLVWLAKKKQAARYKAKV